MTAGAVLAPVVTGSNRGEDPGAGALAVAGALVAGGAITGYLIGKRHCPEIEADASGTRPSARGASPRRPSSTQLGAVGGAVTADPSGSGEWVARCPASHTP